MATNTDNNNIATSVYEQDNIVVVINFSKDGEQLMEFKHSLLDQVSSTTVSNEVSFLVTLDNKYYTADIKFLLYPTSINTSNIDEIIKILPTAQALVVVIDSSDSSWSLLQELWGEKISQECNADVQLVCVYGDSIQSNSDHPNFLWTVNEHFEFISMSEQTDIDNDESFLKEKFGIARMLEALQTHVWSTIKMKDNSPHKPVIPTKEPQMNGDNTQNTQKSEDKIDSLLDGMSLASELNGDECESFEKLLGKLMAMREKAATLEGEEKRDFAEKVVNLFMNALPETEDD